MESYVPFFTHLRSPLYRQTRLKLLQAPERRVTMNGSSSSAWFDLKSSGRFMRPEEEVIDLGQLEEVKGYV